MNLCDYSDPYILATGNVTTTAGDANTRVAFKNCPPFTKCITHINDEHVDNADNVDIKMPMHNLIECNDNHLENSVYDSLKEINHLQQILEILAMILQLIQYPLNTNQDVSKPLTNCCW